MLLPWLRAIYLVGMSGNDSCLLASPRPQQVKETSGVFWGLRLGSRVGYRENGVSM